LVHVTDLREEMQEVALVKFFMASEVSAAEIMLSMLEIFTSRPQPELKVVKLFFSRGQISQISETIFCKQNYSVNIN